MAVGSRRIADRLTTEFVTTQLACVGRCLVGADVHDRLQLAFPELNTLESDDIDKLMRVLAAMRDGNCAPDTY